MALTTAFLKPPMFVEFPAVPVDAFNMCGIAVDLQFMSVPSSLGTAFGASLRWFWLLARNPIADLEVYLELSAFLAIAWYTYRNKSALKFSALVRTIVSEATIYFLVMVAVQTYIQISLSLVEVQSLPWPRSVL